MNIQEAYNAWSVSYDGVINKTRDLEAFALRSQLADSNFNSVLEIGCGTGKNTEWLVTKAAMVTAADFSEEMLNKAKEKIISSNAVFRHTDITKAWNFEENQFDLITCSLVLEHIENIDFIFQEATSVLKTDGLFYIGELHPFKQYQGSKARFENGNDVFVLDCFVHHTADFFQAAKNNNFICIELKEWFDDNEMAAVPRLLTMIFKNKK